VQGQYAGSGPAVVRLGERTIVFVKSGETADGKLRFERRAVKLAEDLPGAFLPVLDGLEPGEVVVSSGAVLLAGS
jgi:hypothetical protein